MSFVPEHGPSTALARPPGKLSTFPVTKLLLADFRSNPERLCGKRFLVPEPTRNGKDKTSGIDGRPLEIFFKVAGIFYREEGKEMEVLFERFHIPDQRPFDEMLDLIASGKVVQS
jgi:hypothetical protein